MINDFYKSIIDLLCKSDIKFYTTDIRPIENTNGTNTVTMNFFDSLKSEPTQLNGTPVISCLVVFTLFDAYLENKHSIPPGLTFRNKYNKLPSITNQDIVERECFRLMKIIRNAFVHNINAIVTANDILHFNYKSPQGTVFNLDISTDKLNLLYSIILILVKGKYEIATNGHFQNVISTYYSELKNDVDNYGNFTDDGDMCGGTPSSYRLMQLAPYIHLNTVVRYPYINPNYEIKDDRIYIKSIYNPGFDCYSADYCVKNNKKEYIIPQEILDTNNSFEISELFLWEEMN